jgi:hypothetical protein
LNLRQPCRRLCFLSIFSIADEAALLSFHKWFGAVGWPRLQQLFVWRMLMKGNVPEWFLESISKSAQTEDIMEKV